jgi:KUP system potassium uptake protein
MNKAKKSPGKTLLTLAALGVVFGDIGTSPLYAMQATFADRGSNTIQLTNNHIYGVVSMMIWLIIAVVSLKYVSFVMRANNNGEGGLISLIGLIQNNLLEKKRKTTLILCGLFGVSLFIGDAIITPSISVLSAVEGVEIIQPSFESIVVPVALTIIVLLFAFQKFGTAKVGNLFGPIILLWFTCLAVLGILQIVNHPDVIKTLLPTYALSFIVEQPLISFIALSAIVLTVTGAEALYADMGHFGRDTIRRAWFVVVFPALILNYMGQAALIIDNPNAVESPFFLMVPSWALAPMIVLAAAAAIIASQAVITGAFSIARQASQLDFLPRIRILHTSEHHPGQVFVPVVNAALFIAVIAMILIFQNSLSLASAYGIAVTGTFFMTSLLFFYVVKYIWKKSNWIVYPGLALFLTLDGLLFSSNMLKVFDGGWVPLGIALTIFSTFLIWHQGRKILLKKRIDSEGSLDCFIDNLYQMKPPLHRPQGTTVFLHPNKKTTPLAMRACVEHNKVLSEQVVIITVNVTGESYVQFKDRLTIDDLGYNDDGIWHLTVNYGYKNQIDIPDALQLAVSEKLLPSTIDSNNASYFLSKINIYRTKLPGMGHIPKRIFLFMSKLSSDPAEFFNIPGNRIIYMGSQIDL